MMSILLGLDSLQAQHPLLFAGLDAFVKATLILLLAGLFRFLYRKLSAANLGLIWLTALTACLAIPVFKLFLPEITLEIPVPGNVLTDSISTASTNNSVPAPGWFSNKNLFLGMIGVYATGVSVLLSHLMISIFSLRQITHRAVETAQDRFVGVLERLAKINGIRSHITMLISSEIDTPFTWGIFRHHLVLPHSALDWDRELIEQAISHELGHIQRNDWICQLCSRLALILYWPNPLAWHAFRSLKIDSEKACDDAVIDCAGTDIGYAANLLSLAGSIRKRPADVSLAMSLFSRPSILSQRVRHILLPDHNRSFLRADEILITTSLVLLLVMPFSTLGLSARAVDQVATRNNFIPFSLADGQRAGRTAPPENNTSMQPPPVIQTKREAGNPVANLEPNPVYQFNVNGALGELQTVREFEINSEPLFEHWEATPIRAPAPAYPLRALRRGIEGYVIAEFRIDDAGKVFNARIIESAPAGIFEHSVLKAVNSSVYCPEIVDGIGGNELPVKKRFSFALRNPG